MAQVNILIVEDEAPLAEMHAEFLRQHHCCGRIWLAGDLAQARQVLERFSPDLLLLDNYLPDGSGITLLRELTRKQFPGGVVFTTAASDMDTVAEAIRCGAFDYLIKPIAYERLRQTLERFSQRTQMLNTRDRASQQQIDDMFNAYARGKTNNELPNGIDRLTLEKVQALFHDAQVRHTAESMAVELGLSRTTARRYLEFCSAHGIIEAEIEYGKVGRPQRIYRIAQKE